MDEFKQLLKTNSAEAQQLAIETREFIRRLLPKIREKIYAGWGLANYGFGEFGRGFMSIGPQKEYVNLYFMNGAELPDPEHLLEGTGKKLRDVKIRTPQELKDKALRRLIKAAIK